MHACAQKSARWLYIYGLMVIAVVIISITRALAFFETTFRCVRHLLPAMCLHYTDWVARMRLWRGTHSSSVRHFCLQEACVGAVWA